MQPSAVCFVLFLFNKILIKHSEYCHVFFSIFQCFTQLCLLLLNTLLFLIPNFERHDVFPIFLWGSSHPRTAFSQSISTLQLFYCHLLKKIYIFKQCLDISFIIQHSLQQFHRRSDQVFAIFPWAFISLGCLDLFHLS